MQRLSDLEYLRLNKFQKFGYNFISFFASIPHKLLNLFKKIGLFFKRLGLGIANFFKDIALTFVHGDWKTRISYLIFGFGNAARGQILRGLLFFLLEAAFVVYMIYVGAPNISKLGSLGTIESYDVEVEIHGRIVKTTIYGDNSFKILLYGVLSIFFIIAVAYTWYLNIKQNRISMEILCTAEKKALKKQRNELVRNYLSEHGKYEQSSEQLATAQHHISEKYEQQLLELPKIRENKRKRKQLMALYKYELSNANQDPELLAQMVDIENQIIHTGKPLKSDKQDVQSLVDDQFHKTLLSLPLLGIIVFTVLPTFFMILIAFTNYAGPDHLPPLKLFQWVGFENFGTIFGWNNGNTYFASTFGEILLWTLIWAFFATFTNYFLGMVVALMINKKGIKGKKIWRGVLVLTIAIPQFISLLFVSKMFDTNGIINHTLLEWGWIKEAIPFFTKKNWARATVIIINIWIGIPYLMLMISGVLMNIPADLYESARIDGANGLQQYFKITLPYTLFVTGPYLLTSFTGNMNNFNVIYLLTGGGPKNNYDMAVAKAGETDLLITWLFRLTVDDSQPNYYMASVIGILVFIVIAVISVIVYNIIPSVKNEEDFQ